MPARLAIITGASSGIGEAAAREFARRGWRTVLVARRHELLSRLAAELSPKAESVPIAADLSDLAAVERAAGEWLARFGPPDALINNAGANELAPFVEREWREHEAVFRLNYDAPARLIHALLPAMLRRRAGHVINICSISAKMGPWGHSSYAAAKAAMVSLTQTLAAEHQGSGVRFSYVNPGIVRTPYFEKPDYRALWEMQKKRAIEPALVASGIADLIDRPRLELCVPAYFRGLDWLKAISPAWAHGIVAKSSRPKR